MIPFFGRSIFLKTELRKKETVNFRNYNKINKNAFAMNLVSQPWEQLATCTTDDMADMFNTFTIDTLDRHAPLCSGYTKPKRMPKPSGKLQRLRRLRDNARSKGKTSQLKKLRRDCNQQTKKEMMEDVKTRLTKNRNEVWKIVSELTGNGSKTCSQIKSEGRVLSGEEAASNFNNFFITKIETIKNGIERFDGDRLSGAKQKAKKLGLVKNSFHLKTVSEKDIVKAIKKSKGSKCPDIYGISPIVLKLAPEIFAVPLTRIINCIIQDGQIPSVWKKTRVLPLHKKKDKSDVANYRPICILPSPSKIMEEIIRQQVGKYMEKMHVLPRTQYGFRAGMSTIMAAGAVDHDWKQAKLENMSCGALFFDLSAAFDVLDKDLIIGKLEAYGAGYNVTKLINSYLTGRHQCVDYHGYRSCMTEVKVGSPQGSVLSPLLFLIMVADLPEWVSSAMTLSYADDTTCYCIDKDKDKVRKHLERSAVEVLTFMRAALLSANPTKTKFIMFGRKGEPALKVGSVEIAESKEEELLGITFNKSLSWKSHLTKMETELRKRIGILKRLSWHLPKSVLIRMIEPIFTAKMRYALELVVDITNNKDHVLERLHHLHRQAMKTVLSIQRNQHPQDAELLKRTKQLSVRQMVIGAMARLAWQCSQDWERNSLTGGRIRLPVHARATRQAESRTFPPQNCESIVGRLVETWEAMPAEIKIESDECRVKRKIRAWVNQETRTGNKK